ncbi:cell division protein FtsQ/DivIB [Periweissella ghanensis]|uniref:Cell division protein DivIB n=1 Tax=Periweissella ghanensis TaxID=467997 RepID=A0ABN8BPE8_9LACO|nr:cell division protein FtsQ/DivIB [Periweissella ghanensis]MCM0600622.1 FtsQ-type POTRA domain-containing protein [Periweissella ghanensis]CAH0418488.1 Cell division protein DivIB [Periweissella ghanensis]
MGDKPENNSQEPSPWDILQIDEASKENKYSQIAEDLFFKRDKKKTMPDTKPSTDEEDITATVKFTKSPVADDQFQFVAVKPNSDELSEEEPVFETPKGPSKLQTALAQLLAMVRVRNLQRQTKQAWLTILGILISLSFFYWVISPSSMVQQISVTGTQNLTPKQVVAATGIKVHRSIFGILLHEQTLEKRALASNNQIKNVTVQVTSPTRLQINVDEATRVGYILRNHKYYLVLEGGKILDQPLTTSNLGLPIYEGFKNKTLFNATINKFATLDTPIRGAVSEIRFSPTKGDPQRIILYMNDGNQVNATIATFADKMAYYPSIAAQMAQPGIVDLQVGAFSYSYEQIKLNKAAAEAKKQQAKAKKELAKKQAEAKKQAADASSAANASSSTNDN